MCKDDIRVFPAIMAHRMCTSLTYLKAALDLDVKYDSTCSEMATTSGGGPSSLRAAVSLHLYCSTPVTVHAAFTESSLALLMSLHTPLLTLLK